MKTPCHGKEGSFTRASAMSLSLGGGGLFAGGTRKSLEVTTGWWSNKDNNIYLKTVQVYILKKGVIKKITQFTI